MPSAQTMLAAHSALVNSNKGAGQSGLFVQAQSNPSIRALQALVDIDNDPRRSA